MKIHLVTKIGVSMRLRAFVDISIICFALETSRVIIFLDSTTLVKLHSTSMCLVVFIEDEIASNIDSYLIIVFKNRWLSNQKANFNENFNPRHFIGKRAIFYNQFLCLILQQLIVFYFSMYEILPVKTQNQEVYF